MHYRNTAMAIRKIYLSLMESIQCILSETGMNPISEGISKNGIDADDPLKGI